MNTLNVYNPATGELSSALPADDAASVCAKASQTRAAQTTWAKVPLADRKACIARFRAGINFCQKKINATEQTIELIARHAEGLAGFARHDACQRVQLGHDASTKACNASFAIS